ncbi:glycosyltransferase family 39 protein [Dokdonella sp.]|uniref:ArnT family glycosyltransferase n=1 Tax=Dokdonella sp. TaxID=2291710 RepID=UPI00260FE62A|nr:glycosyltransferase family 39 protein [Dokdonella sp.]
MSTRPLFSVVSVPRLFLLVACVFIYAIAFQGARGLYSPDEGRYTNVALGMLDSGDWLHPHLHPEVEHWSKPPLTYWAIAASVATFGRTEFAARLPGALAFSVTILLLGRLGRRFVPLQPWLPALVYASFVFPSLAANLVTTDSLLAMWEAMQVAAFVDLWHAADARAARRARWWLGLAAGLAFLTKGPPGLLALAACFLFAYWSEGRPGLRRAFAWDAFALLLVVGGSWYVVVALQEPGVMRYFLVEEVVNRVASDKMRRNPEWYGAFKVYLPTLLLGSLPWLPWIMREGWRARRGGITRVRGDEGLRLLACWLLLPLLVFGLSRSRLPLYVLPLFAPLAILAARALAPLDTTRPWLRVALGLWFVLLLAARLVPAHLNVAADDRLLAKGIAQQLDPLPDEVAFVASAPRFGLRFYLHASIERLRLPRQDAVPQSEAIEEELGEPEGCRLLMVAPEQRVALESELARHAIVGWRLRDVAGYALLAQIGDDCSWSPPKSPTSP